MISTLASVFLAAGKNTEAMRCAGGAWRLLICAAYLLAASSSVTAIELGEYSAAELRGDGWSATGVTIQLEIADDSSFIGQLTAAVVRLPEWQIELRNVKANCPRLRLNASSLSCTNARISLQGLPLDASRFNGSFRFSFDTGETLLELPALSIAGGQVSARIQTDANGWQSQIGARNVGLAGLKAAASKWFALPLPDGVDGRLEAQFRLSGNAALDGARGSARLYAISGSNAAGTLASENLGAKFDFSARNDKTGLQVDVELRESEGQVYALPVFIDFANNPMQARIAMTIPENGDWPLDFTIRQSGVGSFSGDLTLDPEAATLRRMSLASGNAVLPGAYDVYLQPFLVGTTADNLETAGTMVLSASYADASLKSLQVELDEIYLDDKRGRFALYGLQGNINWQDQNIGRSELDWQGGYLYKVGLGQAHLTMDTGNNTITLVDSTIIPVLDGQLSVSRFQLAHSGSSLRDLEFEADFDGIGLRALTRALGWPPFSGTLSGRIPRMRLADNTITVAGTMSAAVFDGLITVDNLRVSEPFGVLPQVNADVKIRALDLAALSATFSFGKMQGRLDGDLSKLRMLGFSPVGFDARLYTTPADRSRHRISQQAIENIADLGGAGAAALLSRGLLRFFEDFAYDEIGWSCVLEDEVCSMNGVEPAPNSGYYIVKGKGLPRINVIGYRSRVSWPTLVAKLRNINASGTSSTP